MKRVGLRLLEPAGEGQTQAGDKTKTIKKRLRRAPGLCSPSMLL